jgi:hypothetical protein
VVPVSRRGPGTRRWSAALTLSLLLVAGAAACGLNPPNDVRVDRRVVGDLAEEPDVRRLPSGPRPGASPEQVVRGFLGAAAAPEADHPLARSFLVPESRWDDQAGATVYDPTTLTVTPAPASSSPGGPAGPGLRTSIRLQAERLATVASDGSFLPAEGRIDLVVPLVRVGRDWRVERPPAGLLLPPRDLLRSYRPVQRYLLSAEANVLVPDPVYLPGTRSSLAGTAVRTLFSGPSRWLAPAVRTVVPPGLTPLGSVVVSDGSAVVDLDRAAFDVPLDVRPLLVGQLAATLGTVPGVDSVRVLAEGRPYQEGEPVGPASVPAELRPGLDGPVYAVAPDGSLLQFQAPRAGEPPAVPVPVPGAPGGLVSAVADPGGSGSIAVLQAVPVGARLLIGPLGRLRPAPIPAGVLVGPTWIPGRGAAVVAGQRLLLVAPSGVVTTLAGPVLGLLGTPREVAVSPDGARILLRTGPLDPTRPKAGEVSTIWLGRVAVRGSTPVVDGWVPVASGLDEAGHLTWSTSTELMVTGRRAGSPVGLWRVDLARLADPVRVPLDGLPAAPTVLTAAAGRGLLVISAEHIWRLDGESWAAVGPARSVAQPH